MNTEDELFELLGDIRASFIELKIHPTNANQTCDEIKTALNKLFPDAECKEVVYTENLDKMFFGLTVLPLFTKEDIARIILEDEDNIRINRYKVEIDSQLISNFVQITPDEGLSFLVYNVGHMINSTGPIRDVRFIIDKIITEQNINFKLSDYISYIDILGFGIKQTIKYLTSIFGKDSTRIRYTEFDDGLEISRFVKSGLTKLINNGKNWDSNENDPGVVMEWALRLYNDILTYRIPAIHTLNKCIETLPSRFVIDEMKRLIERLNRIDDFSILKESADEYKPIQKMIESKTYNISDLKDQYQIIRALPVESISEAHSTLHKINCNMSYINYLLESDDMDRKTGFTLLDINEDYNNLRQFIVSDKLESLYKV